MTTSLAEADFGHCKFEFCREGARIISGYDRSVQKMIPRSLTSEGLVTFADLFEQRLTYPQSNALNMSSNKHLEGPWGLLAEIAVGAKAHATFARALQLVPDEETLGGSDEWHPPASDFDMEVDD